MLGRYSERGIERTSSVCAHTCCSHGIVLVKAALLDELLGHYVAGGEEDLWLTISQCPIVYCSMSIVGYAVVALAIRVANCGFGMRKSYTGSNRLRKQRRCLELRLVPVQLLVSHSLKFVYFVVSSFELTT